MVKRLLWLTLLLPLVLRSKEFPEQPANFVTDVAGVLSSEQQGSLNNRLKAYQDSTSTQFFVYIADTLMGQDMSRLCQQIFDAWKIGSEKNNGLLIAVFVKDHKFRIHSGYGLEGALPDLAIKQVQEEVMAPAFKSGNYYIGLDAGIDALIKAVGKEFVAGEKKTEGMNDDIVNAYAFNVLMLAIVLLLSIKSTHSARYKKNLRVASVIFALIPYFGGLMLIVSAVLSRANRINWLPLLVAAFRAGKNRQANSSFADSNSYSESSSSNSSSESSSSDSSFDGGGGGDSGGGGSDSSW